MYSKRVLIFVVLVTLLSFCFETTSGQNGHRQRPSQGGNRESGGGSGRCNLDDTQQTQGECRKIRECSYAVGRLRAGTSVKMCPGRQNDIVCCPTEPTLAQKKCQKWEDYLMQPELYGHPKFPQPECAYKQLGQFIVGGRAASLYEFPHSVALGFGNDKSSAKFECGATLIDSKYIITAAHCVKTDRSKGRPRWALIGDVSLQKRSEVPFNRKVLPIVEWIVHPEYNPPLTYNDIAILRLGEELEINRYVLPACLADSSTTPTGGPIEATGWGLLGAGERQSSVLQAVNLTIIKPKDCNGYFNDAVEKSIRYPEGIVKSQLCAGDKEGEKDTCNGDSGGGITVNPRVRCLFYIVGVTSFGAKLCGYGQPGVYTKILSHIDWIEQTIWR